MRLEETLLADTTARPAVLVAHSLGCHLVAAWAAHTRHSARVAGALLVAPPDLAQPGLPPQVQAWLPHRASGSSASVAPPPLPFASCAVLSADDPFCSAQRGQQMAAAWGSPVHWLRAAGHVNADSGLGDWPEGLALLQALACSVGLPLEPQAS